MVSLNDMNELRRIVTNTYDEDKACINRVLRGISELVTENLKLRTEVANLKKQLPVEKK